MRERIRNYELMIIISPLYSSEERVAEIIERLRNIIETNQGAVTSVNHRAPWGRRKLAYPIRAYAGGEASRRNFTEGYYVLFHFTMPTDKVAEVERAIRITDHVFRYLITVVEEPKKARLNGNELLYLEEGDWMSSQEESTTAGEEEDSRGMSTADDEQHQEITKP